jgi:hypothetical protein
MPGFLHPLRLRRTALKDRFHPAITRLPVTKAV